MGQGPAIKFQNLSIRTKLVCLLVLMAVISALTVTLPLAVFDFINVRNAMIRDSWALADVLGRNSSGAIISNDRHAAQEVLQALTAVPNINAGCIFTHDGTPLAMYVRAGGKSIPSLSARPTSRFDSGRLAMSRDIAVAGKSIGSIYLEPDLTALHSRLRNYSLAVACSLLVTLLLGYNIAVHLQQPICRPALALVRTAQEISKAADYSIRADVSSGDEFGLLASEFNGMLDQIQARDQQLQHRREELEAEVTSRTKELVNANAQLRQAEEKYRLIFEDAVIGMFQVTPEGKPLSVNRALAEMHGYETAASFVANIVDVPSQLFVNPDQFAEMRDSIAHTGVLRGKEVEVIRRDGTRKWAMANIREVRAADGHVEYYEGSLEDVTDHKLAQQRIQMLAHYDELTELPNRPLLQDRLSKALASATRRNEKVGLLFLDLDRFKIINDSLGHSVGDLLLQQVAARLKQWAREQDTVARIGGDEFVIVLTGIRDINDAAVAAERLMDAITPEFETQGHSFAVSCSIGISIFPDHGTDSETLVKNADAAMYSAKESGRNAFRFFTEEMNEQVVERMTFERDLRLALERHEFFLVYQPQIELATGRIIGLEALLRWQHPSLGLVPPEKFIRVAESSGLILPIGEWVMRTACTAAREWRDQMLPVQRIAIKVSALQFRREGFRDMMEKSLLESGLEPEQLELELTESILISNTEVVLPLLRGLNKLGVLLALDDFGTGYSSLSDLSQVPVHRVKIDRSFVSTATSNQDNAAIIRAIISMCKSLNLKVLAEGVENRAQVSFLEALGCDEAQGYYYGRPVPASDVPSVLASYLAAPPVYLSSLTSANAH